MSGSADEDRRGQAAPFLRWHMATALFLMTAFFALLAAWGSIAPLGGAVIAPGIVSVESHRKAIQHLEGGIVNKILVKEGAQVRRGDVLVELAEVASAAAVDRLTIQHCEALAALARLVAERDNRAAIAFPEELTAVGDKDRALAAAAAMKAQEKLFASRRSLLAQRLSVIDKKIERLQAETVGQGEQIAALETQLKLVDAERADLVTLYAKQLTRKTRVSEVQREQAQIQGRLGAQRSALAQSRQQVAELELSKAELVSSNLVGVVDELRAVQARASELGRELTAALDVRARTKIRAPLDGTVLGLQIHSPGGVIAKGQTLMEIIPESDGLIVEAHVRPESIEEVRAGLPAHVVLNTLSRRYSQPIKGRLAAVSADRILDRITNRPFYAVRIEIDSIPREIGDAKLLAGMSAEVYIQTGERTALAYLAAPILRTFHRGMREK